MVIWQIRYGIILLPLICLLLMCNNNNNNHSKLSVTLNGFNADKGSPDGVSLYRLMLAAKEILNQDDTLPCTENFEYIGFLKDLNDQTYHIVNYSIEWGTNCRLTTRLIIYSKNGKCLGSYYTHGILPEQILDNQLYFDDTLISFKSGIPVKLNLTNLIFDFEKY